MKVPRKETDACAHTKATHLTSLSECSRLYGELAKTKLINGTVTRVIVDRSMKRARTLIEALWILNGQKRIVKETALCNVVADRSPDTLAAGRKVLERQPLCRVVVFRGRKGNCCPVVQESSDQSELIDDDQLNVTFQGEVADVP